MLTLPKYCQCGNRTRKIIDNSEEIQEISTPAENRSDKCQGTFAFRQSHYATDTLCWRCAKPEGYFAPGKMS